MVLWALEKNVGKVSGWMNDTPYIAMTFRAPAVLKTGKLRKVLSPRRNNMVIMNNLQFQKAFALCTSMRRATILRIQLQLNTALLSTVRVSVRSSQA